MSEVLFILTLGMACAALLGWGFKALPQERWQMLAAYRELFMSPCLSGWDEGEEKHRYMHLCHQVLSRSQLNAVAKLREAGIITRNLVIMPNLSNVSLAGHRQINWFFVI